MKAGKMVISSVFLLFPYCLVEVVWGLHFDTCLTVTNAIDSSNSEGGTLKFSKYDRTSIGASTIFPPSEGNRFDYSYGGDVTIKVQVYGMTVKDEYSGKNRRLKGWIHLVISFVPPADPYYWEIQDMILEFHKENHWNGVYGDGKFYSTITTGEFVHDFPGYEKCPDAAEDIRNGKAQKPSPFQFLPCQGVPTAEPLVSNAYGYDIKSQKIHGGGKNLKVHHLFWRYTEAPKCNRVTGYLSFKSFSKYKTPHSAWRGNDRSWASKLWILEVGQEMNAPDPIPHEGNSEWNCKANLKDSKIFPEVKQVLLQPQNDNANLFDHSERANCKINPFATDDHVKEIKRKKFGGRCKDYTLSKGKGDNILEGDSSIPHKCVTGHKMDDVYKVPDSGEYDDYIQREVVDKQSKPFCACPKIPKNNDLGPTTTTTTKRTTTTTKKPTTTTTTTKKPTTTTKKPTTTTTTTKKPTTTTTTIKPGGIDGGINNGEINGNGSNEGTDGNNNGTDGGRKNDSLVDLPPSIRFGDGGGAAGDWSNPTAAAAYAIWSFRKLHGLLHVLGVYFLTPVAIFLSRYYKETWMTSKILFQPIWLIVHLGFLLGCLFLHVIGIHSTRLGSAMIGNSRSETATLHRALGYATCALFAFLVLFGACRPISKTMRIFSIFLHWFLGMIAYALNFACVLTSIDIPGSPSATDDPSLLKRSGRFPFVLVITIFWIVLDLIFHGIANVHMCMMDVKSGVKRSYYPVPIPTIDEDEEEDTEGSGFRKILLCVYLGVCGLVTGAVFVFILHETSNGRGFLEMTFTHDDSGALYNSVMDSPAVNLSFTRTFPPFF